MGRRLPTRIVAFKLGTSRRSLGSRSAVLHWPLVSWFCSGPTGTPRLGWTRARARRRWGSMETFDRASWCAAMALVAAACAPQVSESGRPCPCSGGEFKCCPTTNTCLVSEACPTENTDSDATADGSRRDDGDAGSADERTETSTLADVSSDGAPDASETDVEASLLDADRP